MKPKCDKMGMKFEKWTPTLMPQLHCSWWGPQGPKQNMWYRFEDLRAIQPEKISNPVQNPPEPNKWPSYVDFGVLRYFLHDPYKQSDVAGVPLLRSATITGNLNLVTLINCRPDQPDCDYIFDIWTIAMAGKLELMRLFCRTLFLQGRPQHICKLRCSVG